MASETSGVSKSGYEGFEALYERTSGLVFKTVLLLCGNRQTAEDATQEAFAKALERWHRLSDKTWTPGWVMTTAMNEARRIHRGRVSAATQDISPSDGQVSPPSEIWDLVRTLPRRQQEAIALYYVADLSVTNVARVLRCSEGTVKKHLWRARQVLAARIEVQTDD